MLRLRTPLTLRILTMLATWAQRWLATRGDETWLKVLNIARAVVRDPVLDEVIEIVESGPPNSTLLRKMITEATPDELEDMLWGATMFRPGRPW